MAEENYRKALQDAEAEVARLNLYRASIDRKLAQLKAAIGALSSLIEEPSKAEDSTIIWDGGISNAIRRVLTEAGVGMTPAQIKSKLIEAEYDLSKYANPSAVIHNTLKRIESQGEVVVVNVPSGIATYALNSFSDEGNAAAIAMADKLANEHIQTYAEATGEEARLRFAKKIEEIEKLGKRVGGLTK